MTPSPDVIAAARMQQRRWNIFSSIQIAQYALESGWGARVPKLPDGTSSFNFFGIKALPGERSVTIATHEFFGGHYRLVDAAFAAFPDAAAAFAAHAELLGAHPQYQRFREACRAGDLEDACKALAGVYATDPTYGGKLMQIIADDRLARFDAAAA